MFISFKNLDSKGNQTFDSQIAKQIYDELRANGVDVFYSNEEVLRKCRSDYGQLIDEALESSKVLILVGTNPDYVKAKWVEYEWRTFNNEIHSGRKNGQILTVLVGMAVDQLPIALRRWESYSSEQIDMVSEMVCGILNKRQEDSNSKKGVLSTRPLIQSISVGSIVSFGSYPQFENEAEPIKWRVLDFLDGKVFMISEYLLDAMKFDSSSSEWSTSELRKWLNDQFYNTAFCEIERKQLSVYYGDYVTLLSTVEAVKYFNGDEDRMPKATAYAVGKGCYVNKQSESSMWWLRSTGNSNVDAACIGIDGHVFGCGYHISRGSHGIRPVILVDFNR